MPTLLVTGFGPYPGAPFNPTAALVKALARLQRDPAAVTIVTHVFATRYAAVDRELPKLIARVKPDALLMFGLAPRAKTLRIETRARNSASFMPDAGAEALPTHAIAPGAASALPMPAPVHRLLGALRDTGVAAVLSHDAGNYLCNYLAWRGAEATRRPSGPRLAAFIHVPQVAHKPRRRAGKPLLTPVQLVLAGERLLRALGAAARR